MNLQQSLPFLLFLVTLQLDSIGQSVYKTPSGKKYHQANCRMVKNVSEEITLGEALKLGLGPCNICKPPAVYGKTKSTPKAQGTANGVQCKGLTKAGKRCKHFTKIANGFCFQHQPK